MWENVPKLWVWSDRESMGLQKCPNDLPLRVNLGPQKWDQSIKSEISLQTSKYFLGVYGGKSWPTLSPCPKLIDPTTRSPILLIKKKCENFDPPFLWPIFATNDFFDLKEWSGGGGVFWGNAQQTPASSKIPMVGVALPLRGARRAPICEKSSKIAIFGHREGESAPIQVRMII